MTSPILLAVPNVSEGRSVSTIAAIGDAFLDEGSTRPHELGAQSDADCVRLLDLHSDPDHHRSVFTLAARPLALAEAMLRGAAAAVERINVMDRPDEQAARGQHPHVGALDVAPVVYLDPAAKGAACAEATSSWAWGR